VLTQEMLHSMRVYLKPGHTDMRSQINGLAAIAEHCMHANPLDKSLFVFCNRRRNILKILYWDRNGFCLWHKRLETEKFNWPRTADAVLEIGHEELSWLLRGLDFRKAHKELHYTSCS
jgi:transposase